MTDTGGTTTLSGTANTQDGTAKSATILPALAATGGYVCQSEATVSIKITGANYDNAGGELSVRLEYLDI